MRRHLGLIHGRTTQQVLQVQFDAALRGNTLEKAGFVEGGFGQAANEIAGGELAIAVTGFQLSRTLVVHHVGVAVNLAVRSTDGCGQSGGVVRCVALRGDAMGAILMIAGPDGDLHRSAGLAKEFAVAQGCFCGCVASPAEGDGSIVEGGGAEAL